ncbi:hypothetical protein CTAM01_00638 [Colletotrichum tamarilloi]|uniref:Uncharacterized protein n=1 Tax=Colletotrichum tamarilloi TaxID=1209934 RepID=A0ABQ9RRR4_9PEZI|nr:uncharacterized protein CTAM01_00638 [Colletotrichum tamarilloi]KAK1511708.1 hypothetical protein CTAM01_00638 [Colletotrichum tamarilloi]
MDEYTFRPARECDEEGTTKSRFRQGLFLLQVPPADPRPTPLMLSGYPRWISDEAVMPFSVLLDAADRTLGEPEMRGLAVEK